MKTIKSTSFKTYTTTSKVDGTTYVIPSDTGVPIQVSDEVADAFKTEFLHEVEVTNLVDAVPGQVSEDTETHTASGSGTEANE